MATQLAGQLGVRLPPEAQTFLFTTTFRLAVGSTHPPIQCVPLHGLKPTVHGTILPLTIRLYEVMCN